MNSHIKIRIDFFIKIYLNKFPNSRNEINQFFNINLFDNLKAFFGLLNLFFINFYNKEFIFITTRNKSIIQCLDKNNILVFGTNFDKKYCNKSGIKFYWHSGIHSAIKLFYNRNSTFFLNIYTTLLNKKLKNLKYLILYEDTLPLGIYFTEFCRDKNKISICIQHAAHTILPFLPVDGFSSKYNLVYDKDQKTFYKDSNSVLIILGLTYDFNKIIEKSKTIILVGTGYYGLDPVFYKRSLKIFSLIKNTLLTDGFNVLYRPHPNENYNIEIQNYFKNNEIDQSSAAILLSKTRKIFIGYNSSLLYEASKIGHIVINIFDEIIPNLIFKTDHTLKITKFDSSIIHKLNDTPIKDIKSTKLKYRLENAFKCINQIENEESNIFYK